MNTYNCEGTCLLSLLMQDFHQLPPVFSKSRTPPDVEAKRANTEGSRIFKTHLYAFETGTWRKSKLVLQLPREGIIILTST